MRGKEMSGGAMWKIREPTKRFLDREEEVRSS
jgi:hypothetical protein